jgi:BirA family biotin operon repressor/biotin-[acetyl-CoA-carboxylase] ligase
MDPNDKKYRLIRRLADGSIHSGEVLAAEAGVTRAAIWKQLRALETSFGLEVESVKGRGYQLRNGVELLDPKLIEAQFGTQARARVGDLRIHTEVDSTNTWLMDEANRSAPCGSVCLAERQTAGRGRHGRTWMSPFGSNIYLSVLWRYPLSPGELGGLSLACGVAVARALTELGVEGIALKWPNDVLWERRKLAGLLLEVQGETAGPCHVVAGVGVNTRLSGRQAGAIGQPWAHLASVPGLAPWTRNGIAAMLIDHLLEAMDRFAATGLAPFVREWSRFDLLRNEWVQLSTGSRQVAGRYLGIAEDGAIRMETGGVETRYNAGEVELCRPRN